MSNLEFYITDTETTGLDSKKQEICEISLIRVSNKMQITRNIKCEFPERASFDALAITGKTIQDLSLGDDKSEVVDLCNKFFDQDEKTVAHRCIIGHNVSFDRRFLHALWEKVGKAFPATLWLDTIDLAKYYIANNDIANLPFTKTATGRLSTNLQSCCDGFQIKKIAQAHNAKHDARNCYLLFKELVESRQIDYLPFIKNVPHQVLQPLNDIEEDLLDI